MKKLINGCDECPLKNDDYENGSDCNAEETGLAPRFDYGKRVQDYCPLLKENITVELLPEGRKKEV